MEFIRFTQVIHMLGSGVMDRVMGWGYRLALMGVLTLGSSSVVSNMALAVIISGEVIFFPIVFQFYLCFEIFERWCES